MPLTFTGNNRTQFQQLNLFKNLKDNKTSDKYIKTYDSCSVKTDSCLNDTDSKSDTLQESSLNERNPMYISEEIDEDAVAETAALRHVSEPSKSLSNNITINDNYLTVPGTIKRGKKKGQSVEVILNMSREELEIIEAKIATKKDFPCCLKTGIGFHILVWTILCFPFSIIFSGVYSFCVGTITWYNVFKYFSENKGVGYRILSPPLLIVLYPFLITGISLGLGLYAGIKQISCCWDSWLKEFTDYEKGFYGWLCNSLDIPECSTYEVVILSSAQNPLR